MEVRIGDSESDIVTLSPKLSATVFAFLRALAAGNTVSISGSPEVLSTTEAARILGVSRPTLMKPVREGRISSFKVGTHSRLRSSDALGFKRQRAEDQVRALDELRELEFELDAKIKK